MNLQNQPYIVPAVCSDCIQSRHVNWIFSLLELEYIFVFSMVGLVITSSPVHVENDQTSYSW